MTKIQNAIRHILQIITYKILFNIKFEPIIKLIKKAMSHI